MNITDLFNKLSKLFYWIVFIVLLIVAGLVASSRLNLPGNIKLYVVQSGSMAPTIYTGSLIISKPHPNYVVGDIITAQDWRNYRQTFTHRVSAREEKDGTVLYQTKGDANQNPEPQLTPSNRILGKVVFWIPVLGYLVSFAKSQFGFMLLVIVPTTIIIYSELMKIKVEAIRLMEERKHRKLSPIEKVEEKIGEEIIEVEKEVKEVEKEVEKEVREVEKEIETHLNPSRSKRNIKKKKKQP